jgi:hypothetical protein
LYKTNYLNLDNVKTFINVKIIGTEKRQSFFNSYTVYIVQTEQNGKISTIYPRFKNLLKIQQLIKERGIQINVPPLYK